MLFFRIFVFTILAYINIYAYEDSRTSLNFSTENNGTLAPELSISILWDENTFSSIGYKSGSSVTTTKVDGFNDSKDAIAIQQQIFTLGLLNYQTSVNDIGFVIGTAVQYINIDKNEFGYIAFSDTNVTSHDNQVGINYYQLLLYAEINKKLLDALDVRLSTFVSPIAKLNVTQTTQLRPLVSTIGTSNSSTYQSIGYELALDMYYETGSFFDLSFRIYLQHLPLTYDLAVLNAKYVFEPSTQTLSSDIFQIDFKVPFRKKVLDMFPFIGYRFMVESETDEKAKLSVSSNYHRLLFGFENRF